MTASVPALLAAALGTWWLAGCTAADDVDPRPTASGAALPPDAVAVASAIGRELGILAAYDDPMTRVASMSAATDEIRSQHEEHLRAIEEAARAAGLPLPQVSPPTPSVAAPSPRSPGATPPLRGPSAVPARDPVELARRLIAAERGNANEGVAAVPAVVDRRLARLLAEIAASESQHATALFIGLREGLIRRALPAAPTPAPRSTP